MLLHDVNSLDTENEEALNGARKSVTLIRLLAPLVRLAVPRSGLSDLIPSAHIRR